MQINKSLDHVGARTQATVLVLVWVIIAVLMSGCSGAGHTPVDPDRARDTLKTALDGWKKGDSPAALKDGSPSIVVQDIDWIGGAKLVDYKVDGDGREVEANLQVPVKLTLMNAKGKSIEKKVSYIVETSPQLMVFRSLR